MNDQKAYDEICQLQDLNADLADELTMARSQIKTMAGMYKYANSEHEKTKALLLQTQQALLYALDEGCGAWERAEIKEKWPQAYEAACEAEEAK